MLRAVTLAFIGTACIEPQLKPCGDLICPPSTVCFAERQVCATQAQLDVCVDQIEGAACVTGLIDGSCVDGLCISSTCGDGVVTGREQCDGEVSALGCTDFRFYYGEPSCTPSCLYDTSACFGACGDSLVQADAGEVCDGNVPEYRCYDLGFDYGHNQCTAACTDDAVFSCGHFVPRPFYQTPPMGILYQPVYDVYRAGPLTVVSGPEGLLIVDHGVTRKIPGEFRAIVGGSASVYVATNTGEVFEVRDLQLFALPPTGASDGVELALTPSGELWILSQACAVQRLVSGAWQTMPPVPGNGCFGPYADSDGDVYAMNALSGVYRFTGTGWNLLAGTSAIRWLGAGASGRVLGTGYDTALEIDGDRVIDLQKPGNWRGGVNIRGHYVLFGAVTTRFGDGDGPDVRLPALDNMNVRRMSDGTVILYSNLAAVLEPMSVGPVVDVATNSLVRAAPGGGFVMSAGAEVSDDTNTVTLPGYIADLDVDANGVVYAATAGGLRTGTIGGSWTVDATVSPTHVRVAGDGSVWVVDDSAVYSKVGSSSFDVRYPLSSGERFGAIVALAQDDVYIAVNEIAVPSRSGRILHFDGQSWTLVRQASVQVGLLAETRFLDGTVLPDGAIVFTGSETQILENGTWRVMPFAAGRVAGTSVNDLWFSGARAKPTSADGIVHWNGSDLAQIRNEMLWPDRIAVTPHLVRITNYIAHQTLVRWVP